MKNERLPATQRLARYRKKDPVLDALIAGHLTTGNGARNDQWLMTLLMYRCFSMREIAEIMGPITTGDNESRAAYGDRYWLMLQRAVLGIGLTPKDRQNQHSQKTANKPRVPIAQRIAALKTHT